MTLQTYQRKRRFDQTPEPKGQLEDTGRQRFVVQEHHASRLHFDFRLEMAGVLVSWALPKGPTLDPKQRHLAVRVEDHPVDYIDFEGHIAEGNYGAGQVVIWDRGSYELLEGGDPLQQLEAGKLAFRLHGQKLRGDFALVRMRARDEKQWLFIKSKDEYAQAGWELTTELNDAGRQPAARSSRPAAKATAGKTSAASKKTPAAKKYTTARKPAPGKSAAAKKAPLRTAAHDSVTSKGPVGANGAGRRAAQAQAPFPAVPGAEAAPMPDRVDPMLATLVNAPPEVDWFFETKWDGVRALAYLNHGWMRLISRNNKELSFRYPELAGLPGWVNTRQAVLDGEIVVLEEDGRSNFQRLQARIGLQDPSEIRRLAGEHPVTYVVFDLLYADGFDLRRGALSDRKALLRQVLQPGHALKYSEHRLGQGAQAFQEAQAAGQEGIIAKRPDSPYMEGRSGAWLKIKTVHRQEVVIGGYTQPRRSRQYLGALVVGLYAADELRYVGHVGGGFNRESLEQVYDLLQPLKSPRSPFAQEPPTNEPVQWVRPERVAEVKFAGWTDDRKLRQPIFLGLRDDKDPRQTTLEVPQPVEIEMKPSTPATKTAADGRGSAHPKRAAVRRASPQPVRPMPATRAFAKPQLSGDLEVRIGGEAVFLTHLDRLYWPDDGITKGDLLRYYWQVQGTLLRYLKDRPLILKRYPNGINQPPFFQHDVDVNKLPHFVQTFNTESEDGRSIDYVLCQNRETLLYLVNLGTLSMNPWNSRVDTIDRPDWMVFDLDPGLVAFRVVCDTALAVKAVLDRAGLKAYAKSSGSRGIHIYVPLKPVHPYAQVAEVAERIARQVAAERADLATVERSKQKRPADKVYVDFLQNAHGKSVASVYSAREHPGATVSAPLDWHEVEACPDLSQFTIHTMPKRLEQTGDLFKAVLGGKQNLDRVPEKLDA